MFLIVAVDENWGIGAKGDLLVNLPEDMKFFKSKTMGKTVIMGSATYESLPGRKPLKGRRNIVVTRNKNFAVEGFEVCHNMEEVFRITEKLDPEDVFIIGGEKIYASFLPYCHGAFVTKIYSVFEAEKYFENLDKSENWIIKNVSEMKSDKDHNFRFVEYQNKAPKKWKGIDAVRSVWLEDDRDAMMILDQTLLPGEKKYLEIKEMKDLWDAIYQLKVRGAPAIGIAAAYGLYLGTKAVKVTSEDELFVRFKEIKDYLASARPTAVNLFWALNRMEKRFISGRGKGVSSTLRALRDESELIRDEDERVCLSIGEHGLDLLEPGWGILTHCNAGTIATAKYGTALAPIYLGQERGYDFKIYADETRPLLQGARLTAWELNEAGVDVTLICDNMASIVMKEGRIDAVLVGCDRVAANGDSANKIGTSGVAILAKHYQIPFYICAPLSTIDLDCPSGKHIHIEQRPASEIIEKWYSMPMAPEDVKVYNPAFDVTDNELITGIITPNGVAYPPYGKSLAEMCEKGVDNGK